MSEVVLAQNPVLASQICGLEGSDGLPGTHHAPMKMAGPSLGTQGQGCSWASVGTWKP